MAWRMDEPDDKDEPVGDMTPDLRRVQLIAYSMIGSMIVLFLVVALTISWQLMHLH